MYWITRCNSGSVMARLYRCQGQRSSSLRLLLRMGGEGPCPPHARLVLLLANLTAVRVGLLFLYRIPVFVLLFSHLADWRDADQTSTAALILNFNHADSRGAANGVVNVLVVAGQGAWPAQRGKHIAGVRSSVHQIGRRILADLSREPDRPDFHCVIVGIVHINQVQVPVPGPEIPVVDRDHSVGVSTIAPADPAGLTDGWKPSHVEGVHVVVKRSGRPSAA